MTRLKTLAVALVAASAVMAGSATAASADVITNVRMSLVRDQHLRSIHATYVPVAGGGTWSGAFCTGVYYYTGGVARAPGPREWDAWGTYTNSGNVLHAQHVEGPGPACNPDIFDWIGPIFHFPPSG